MSLLPSKFIKPLPLYCLYLVFGLLSSCTLVFNSKTIPLTIHTDTPVKIVFDNDTVQSYGKYKKLVPRSFTPFTFKVVNDSIKKEVNIYSKNSLAYSYDLLNTFGLASIILKDNPQRYTYQRNIYIGESDNYNNILKYDTSFSGNFIFKTTTLAPIKWANLGFELAVEKAVGKGKQSSIQLSYLQLVGKGVLDEAFGAKKIRGQIVGLEFRRFFNKHNLNGRYFGIEVAVLNRKHRIEEEFYNEIGSTKKYFSDVITVNRNTITTSLKVGQQWIKNHWVYDVYVGLGYRIKQVKFSNLKDENATFSTDYRFFALDSQEGTMIRLHLPLNFRVGYTF